MNKLKKSKIIIGTIITVTFITQLINEEILSGIITSLSQILLLIVFIYLELYSTEQTIKDIDRNEIENFAFKIMVKYNSIDEPTAHLAAELVNDMVLKDSNHTPFLDMIDFVGFYYKKMKNMTLYQALNYFYSNYESAEYR